MAMSYAHTYCRRTSASTRLRRPGAATCSSCCVDARLMRGAACIGMGGLSVSRPSLINTTRCSVTRHSEQTNVWCSTPRRATVSFGTTLVRINSEPHAVQRIARTPTALTYRALTPLFAMPKLCSRLRRSHSRSIQLPQAVHQRARIAQQTGAIEMVPQFS
jgi:hypothetical protein